MANKSITSALNISYETIIRACLGYQFVKNYIWQ